MKSKGVEGLASWGRWKGPGPCQGQAPNQGGKDAEDILGAAAPFTSKWGVTVTAEGDYILAGVPLDCQLTGVH